MCPTGDSVSFYVGHPGGDPPPIAPRYEFLEALRRVGPAAAAERVQRNVRLLVAAIDRSKLAADRDHNFLSRKTLVKIIPYVILEAHEKCKALGRQLDTKPENRLRSALHRLGLRYRCDLRLDLDGVRIRPDVVFTRRRVAVFVDGCYWHGCPDHGRLPASNRAYWTAKIAGNRIRDQRA